MMCHPLLHPLSGLKMEDGNGALENVVRLQHSSQPPSSSTLRLLLCCLPTFISNSRGGSSNYTDSSERPMPMYCIKQLPPSATWIAGEVCLDLCVYNSNNCYLKHLGCWKVNVKVTERICRWTGIPHDWCKPEGNGVEENIFYSVRSNCGQCFQETNSR